MTTSGWIGVDLDQWLAEGKAVRIFTARVAVSGGYSLESNRHADTDMADEQRKLIEAWCKRHLGQVLPVTATKDFAMIELWDDRAVTVQLNTGRVLTRLPDEE